MARTAVRDRVRCDCERCDGARRRFRVLVLIAVGGTIAWGAIVATTISLVFGGKQ